MQLMEQITSDARQKQAFVLPDGSTFTLELAFKPQQLGWFIEAITYKEFVLKGYRICTSPNIMYQFKNQIPFGIACLTDENQEPTQQQDFESGRSKLYLLDGVDIANLAEIYSGQV